MTLNNTVIIRFQWSISNWKACMTNYDCTIEIELSIELFKNEVIRVLMVLCGYENGNDLKLK